MHFLITSVPTYSRISLLILTFHLKFTNVYKFQKSRLHRQACGPTYTMDIFKNCNQIYVARGSTPRCSDLRELITLCQGKVTSILRNAVIIVGGYVDNSKVTCVNETWVLDSITKYKKMPVKNYLIKSENGVVV